MKIYNKEIIKNLQHAINKNNFTMVTFKDYSFITPPYIQIAELKIQLNGLILEDIKLMTLKILNGII